MKKLSKFAIVTLIIFLIIVTAALFSVKPVYKKLLNTISDVTTNITSIVSDKTGLYVSYEGFSPSILNSFKIKKIALRDENGNLVIGIKSIIVKYKLSELLKGKIDNVISSVLIDGVDVDGKRLMDVISKLETQPQEETEPIEIQQILDFIPVKISIRNIHVFYDDDALNADFSLKNLSIMNFKDKEYIELSLKSNAKAYLKQNKMNVSGSLSATGTLYSNIDNSFLNIKFNDLRNDDFKLSKINLLATYRDKKIEAHTIQSTIPLYLGTEIDLETMDINAKVETENFYVNSLVSELSRKNMLAPLKSLRFTLKADAHFNPKTMNIGYNSSGRVFVGDKLFPGSVNVGYRLSGNDRRINVSSLLVNGPLCDISGNLDFTFATLQLGGFVDLKRFSLPNKKTVSTEIYIDPLPRGFMLFAPQVYLGDKTLTALQGELIPLKDSLDFELEVSDYSSITSGSPGSIKVDGSYMTSSNYVQANISLNSMSIGSVLEYAQQAMDDQTAEGLAGTVELTKPYIFTGDMYVSTDFKSISYNVPYFILANTVDENQYVFLSANGNNQSVQIDRCDIIYGKYAVGLNGSFDFNPSTKDGYFIANLLFAGIPYHMSGVIMPELITISGDYGINGEIRIGKKKDITGDFYIDNLPIIFDKINLLFSLDTYFSITQENGPDVKVSRLEIKDNKKGTPDEPKLLLTGTGSKYGARIESIAYTDEISAMYGSADVTYSFNDGIFENGTADFYIKNELSDEIITLKATLSNPGQVAFSSPEILDSIYIDTSLDIHHFSLNRFLPVKNKDNEITADISVTGTLSNPYGVINLKNASMLLGNELISASGSLLLEDKILSVEKFFVKFGGMKINNFSGSASVDKMTGKFNAVVTAGEGDAGFTIPITIKLFDSHIPEGSFLPESFMVSIASDRIKSSMLKKKVGFEITANYSKDIISIYSSDNLGLVGSYLTSTGDLYGSINSGDIMSLKLDGRFNQNTVNIRLSDININLNKLISYYDVKDMILIESGIIKGALTLSGSLDTPDFKGALTINKPKLYIPSVFPDDLSADVLMLTAANNELTLREDTYYMKKDPIFTLGAKIFLDKWQVDTISAKMTTLKKKYLPLKFKSPFVNINGKIGADVNMNFSDFTWDISGTVFGDNISIVSNLTDITAAATAKPAKPAVKEETKPKAPASKVCLRTDLNVILGTHVMLNFNPILRCIFAPNTRIGLNIDTEADIYEIEGGLGIKSGDISYLNRSFYIKEGNIKFDSSDLSNPLVNLRAETKVRDEKGKNVTVILSAENQYLQDFNPKFTSKPLKSEMEILDLLGQIVVADADSMSDILISGADYAFQSTVVRGVENKLRDLMNFDIFSIRTNVVQNALDLGTSGNISKDDISIGNFLDNSTVYMGKYLDSSLYVDAQLSFSLENGNVNDPTKANGLMVQPEIGLELELPIANIRWSLAPDIQAMLDGQFVPSNSLSLSWDFKF